MATLHRLASTDRPEQLNLKLQRGSTNRQAVSLKILRYDRLESTNSTAYRLGEGGADEWTVVVARSQTKGRGRVGKKWMSPKGGLWFSIILRPSIPSVRVPMLQFFAANATRQAIEKQTGLRPRVKWPNDLVLESGKLGGILVESKTQGEKVRFAVVGIGLNINQPKSKLPEGATSTLLNMGKRIETLRLLRSIVHGFESTYDRLSNPSKIAEEWWRNCIHRPLKVKVSLSNGSIVGITRSMDSEGNLIVETDDHRIHTVNDGTLRLLAASRG